MAKILVKALLFLLPLPSFALALAGPPLITYPAGSYTVATPASTTITYTDTSVTFSWGAEPPAPPPIPPPAPIPVLTGHVWALAIYDPDVTLPTAQQAMLNDTVLKTNLLLQDVDLQPFKSTDPSVTGYLKKLPATGLPGLLLVQRNPDGTGIVALSVPLPNTAADLITLVNKVRGKH